MNLKIEIKVSPKFVHKSPINKIAALVQVMAWCWPGDKPLSEPMMIRLPTNICVTRPQWVQRGFWWMPFRGNCVLIITRYFKYDFSYIKREMFCIYNRTESFTFCCQIYWSLDWLIFISWIKTVKQYTEDLYRWNTLIYSVQWLRLGQYCIIAQHYNDAIRLLMRLKSSKTRLLVQELIETTNK